MADILSEYMIKLGAVVDQSGMAHFQRAFQEAASVATTNLADIASGALKVEATLVGAFATIGGAILGMVDKVAMADQEYRLFALHMYMSKDAARSLKVAMDALGQPLENLMWDTELRGRTRQLIEDQKMMAAEIGPDFDANMRKVRDVRFEVTRLEVGVKYLGFAIVNDLMRALGPGADVLLKKLRDFNEWFIKNLPQIASKLTTYLVPILKDIWRIMTDIWQVAMDFAGVFDTIVGLLSGDHTLTGVASFDKFAHSIEIVVHWIAVATDYLSNFIGLLAGTVGGATVGGILGTIIGGIAGIPGGPVGIVAGGIAGGATGTAIGGIAGGVTGGIFDLYRHFALHGGNQSSGASSDTSSSTDLASQARQLAQAVSARTGVNANYIWSQWAHETGNFTHLGAANNLAGINIPGGNGTQYRSFASLNDFGDYYAKLIGPGGRYSGVGGARSADDFASALKSSGYYSGPESAYATDMARFGSIYDRGGGGRNGSGVTVGSIVINVTQPGASPEQISNHVITKLHEESAKQVQRNQQEWAQLYATG